MEDPDIMLKEERLAAGYCVRSVSVVDQPTHHSTHPEASHKLLGVGVPVF